MKWLPEFVGICVVKQKMPACPIHICCPAVHICKVQLGLLRGSFAGIYGLHVSMG
jgi:hypothetical protein